MRSINYTQHKQQKNILIKALSRFLKENDLCNQYYLSRIYTFFKSHENVSLDDILSCLNIPFNWDKCPKGDEYMCHQHIKFLKLAFYCNLLYGNAECHHALYHKYKHAVFAYYNIVTVSNSQPRLLKYLSDEMGCVNFFKDLDFESSKFLCEF